MTQFIQLRVQPKAITSARHQIRKRWAICQALSERKHNLLSCIVLTVATGKTIMIAVDRDERIGAKHTKSRKDRDHWPSHNYYPCSIQKDESAAGPCGDSSGEFFELSIFTHKHLLHNHTKHHEKQSRFASRPPFPHSHFLEKSGPSTPGAYT
jgi:hypothetical protein